jgi:hypothetical protein
MIPPMCEHETRTKSAAANVEITAEMIVAGRNALYCYRITDPDEAEMGAAVAAVFKAMLSAHL